MRPALVLLASALLRAATHAQPGRDVRSGAAEESARPAGCANLTLVLDNWKHAIVTRVQDLLLRDHGAVLPEYGRIRPLSDALGDLYADVNALKQRLAELTARFAGVEALVHDARPGRSPRPPRGQHRARVSVPGEAPPHRRRSWVVVRRITKPAGSQD